MTPKSQPPPGPAYTEKESSCFWKKNIFQFANMHALYTSINQF